jgi:hypothetical protein
VNNDQLKQAISASADYANLQRGATIGERATCFLASLSSNVVLDRDLSHKLFSLLGVHEHVNTVHNEHDDAPRMISTDPDQQAASVYSTPPDDGTLTIAKLMQLVCAIIVAGLFIVYLHEIRAFMQACLRFIGGAL